jgi:CRP/FNR family cyclic AMP-dependent transcriptional regulator
VTCDPSIFEDVPLFSRLDADERRVLAENVVVRRFPARQKIYRVGDPGGRAFLVVSGKVQVAVVDEDKQEIVVDTPERGDIFGLTSLLDESPHQTTAVALEDTVALEIDRNDISTLLEKKPHAGLDMLTMVGRHFRAAQHLVRTRATRNPNIAIEETETMGDRIADKVARFGGSWAFLTAFLIIMIAYVAANTVLPNRWDPYPFILLNLFLSMIAAIQAPIIMMSQNRQDAKDRVRGELDYRINLKAEMEVSQLIEKVDRIETLLEESAAKA